MKNYFLSNKDWGDCYTVMANDQKEAIKIVKKFIKDEEEKLEKYERTGDRVLDRQLKKVGDVKIGENDFDVIEFGSGEVIETEYA